MAMWPGPCQHSQRGNAVKPLLFADTFPRSVQSSPSGTDSSGKCSGKTEWRQQVRLSRSAVEQHVAPWGVAIIGMRSWWGTSEQCASPTQVSVPASGLLLPPNTFFASKNTRLTPSADAITARETHLYRWRFPFKGKCPSSSVLKRQ